MGVTYKINNGPFQSNNAILNATTIFSIPNPVQSPSLTSMTMQLHLTSNGVCNQPLSGTADVTIKKLPEPDAGPDLVLCRGQESFTLVNASQSATDVFVWKDASNTTYQSGVSYPTSTTQFSQTTFTPVLFTLTATAQNGCIKSDNKLVTVLPVPNINAVTSRVRCEGSQIGLPAITLT